MPTVTFDPSFFRRELDAYGDWQRAFAREMLQNAVDAGASHIEVTVDREQRRVVVTDDGCGMDAATLREVFFAVGATTKHGDGQVGGFGRARVVLCFAQRSYRIRTHDLVAEGSGGDYQVRARHLDEPAVAGCRFEVELTGDDVSRLPEAFRAEAALSALQADVVVDGTVAPTGTLPARAHRVLRDGDGVPWGRVYVQQARPNTVRVRCRGLHMYSRYVRGCPGIVLEIEPRRARQVLTATRDRLHSPYDGQLDEFVGRLTTDRRGALRPDDQPLRECVGPGLLQVAGHLDRECRDGPVHAPAHRADHRGVAAPVAPPDPGPGGPDPLTRVYAPLSTDVFLLCERRDARARRLARRWSPAGWSDSRGSRRRALLEYWQRCVELCLAELAELSPQSFPVQWAPGFTFDDDLGQCLRLGKGEGGGPFAIVVNPVDGDDRIRWRLGQLSDRRHLLALAAHEVAHVVEPRHDEDFANLLTSLVARLAAPPPR